MEAVEIFHRSEKRENILVTIWAVILPMKDND